MGLPPSNKTRCPYMLVTLRRELAPHAYQRCACTCDMLSKVSYSISFASISVANWDPRGKYSTGMSTPTRLRETKGRVEEIEREDQDIKEWSACVDQSIQNVLCFSSYWLAWSNGIVFGVTLYVGSFCITRAASLFLLRLHFYSLTVARSVVSLFLIFPSPR